MIWTHQTACKLSHFYRRRPRIGKTLRRRRTLRMSRRGKEKVELLHVASVVRARSTSTDGQVVADEIALGQDTDGRT